MYNVSCEGFFINSGIPCMTMKRCRKTLNFLRNIVKWKWFPSITFAFAQMTHFESQPDLKDRKAQAEVMVTRILRYYIWYEAEIFTSLIDNWSRMMTTFLLISWKIGSWFAKPAPTTWPNCGVTNHQFHLMFARRQFCHLSLKRVCPMFIILIL